MVPILIVPYGRLWKLYGFDKNQRPERDAAPQSIRPRIPSPETGADFF